MAFFRNNKNMQHHPKSRQKDPERLLNSISMVIKRHLSKSFTKLFLYAEKTHENSFDEEIRHYDIESEATT